MSNSLCSIVLPTYNRAKFLPAAFAAITAQTISDWELIVVDDGSVDCTKRLVAEFAKSVPQQVRYVHQPNAGPGVARRNGIKLAAGSLLAFFDSDDHWLPHHLEDCVSAMTAHEDVDWICSDMRRVDQATGRVILPSKFDNCGRPLPFLRLNAEVRDALHVIDDPGLAECLIRHAGFESLQCSLIRSSVFERVEFPHFRVGEDRVLAIRAALSDLRLAYFKHVHVEFRVHDSHTAAPAVETAAQKRIEVMERLFEAYESLANDPAVPKRYRTLVRRRLANECFWNLGYILWRQSNRGIAMKYLARGMQYDPWSVALWKTYAACRLRSLVGV